MLIIHRTKKNMFNQSNRSLSKCNVAGWVETNLCQKIQKQKKTGKYLCCIEYLVIEYRSWSIDLLWMNFEFNEESA